MSITLPNLLVTGGAGFIGNNFVAQAVARGHRVVVLDAMTYAGHKENLEWIEPGESGGSFELIIGNICNGTLVSDLLEKHEISAIVNFAAESHVDNSISKPADFIETNILGAYTLLEAGRAYWMNLPPSRKPAFRFVQISTDEVYGSLGPDGKFTEQTPMRPNSPYSASKASADHLARAWFETYKFPTVITNCTNNYGPRQHPEKLIPRMITCALSGKPLPIYGDGKNVRDWIHVEDHCHGVYLALTKGKPGEKYCFGGNAERNNLELVEALCKVLDRLTPREDGQSYFSQRSFVADRPGHDFRYAIDDSKAQHELGFTRMYSFEEGLEDTVKWYIANRNWCESVTKKAA